MLLLHFSDLHVTDDHRLDDQARILGEIVDAGIAAGVQAWLLTGDVYGRTVPHRSAPAERAVVYPVIRRMCEVAPVVVTTGNHDYPGDLDTLRELGGAWGWPVHVVDRAQVVELRIPGGEVVDVFALPYPTKRWLIPDAARLGVEELRVEVGRKLALLLSLWKARITREHDRAWKESRAPRVSIFAGHVLVTGSRTAGSEVLAGQEIELGRDDLAGLGCDYVALGHVHARQELAPGVWYAGSPWLTDFGDHGRKGFHLVKVGGRRIPAVEFVPTSHRELVTLDYRWDLARDGEGSGAWYRSGLAELEAELGTDGRSARSVLRDAEVRMRLVVPGQWAAGCPWDAEIERVKELAWRVVVERKVEPVLRVRAPDVAAATTPEEKLPAYWRTLATPPTKDEQGAALAALAELRTDDDDEIAAATASLLPPATETTDATATPDDPRSDALPLFA